MSKKKDKKGWLYEGVKWFWLLALSPLVAIVAVMTVIALFSDLPGFDELENPKSNLATEVYTADGRLLGKYFRENRTRADFGEISPYVVQALVATEDERFYQHSGIDFRRLLTATLFLGTRGGASTITQQLAKLLFHERPDTKFERIIQKLQEWIIAIRLERQYTKTEIITMYLNKFDFINNAVGIKSAAQVYFNTTADSLDIVQAATLVGMVKNPSLFNPRRRPEMCEKRRNVVFYQMKRNELIDQITFDSLKQIPLQLEYRSVDHKQGPAPYFREVLRAFITEKLAQKNERDEFIIQKSDGSKYDLYRDGLKIYTTIDWRMQKYAEWAMERHFGGELQPDFWAHIRRKKNPPFGNDVSPSEIENLMRQAMKRSDLYRELKAEGLSQDSIQIVFNTPQPTTIFSWKGEIDTVMSPMEQLRYNKCFLQSGLMSVNPRNGHVKAWVGGINYKHFAYDHVYQSRRQIGSTIKPFVYAMGIIDMGMSPCDEVANVPYTFEKGQFGILRDWTPHNPGRDYGGAVLLKVGLAKSMNNITAYVMKQTSPQAVVDFVKRAGLEGEIDPVPALCLGVADVSVYEMVGAYASFANKGLYLQPIFVTRIVDKDGMEIYNGAADRKSNVVMSERDAYVMLELMKGVTSYTYNPSSNKREAGTAVRLRFDKSVRPYGGIPASTPIAGKTGTTQNQSDGWFIGITPDLVTGVWTGAEDRAVRFSNLEKGSGTNMALPVWGYFMNKVYADNTLKISKGDFEKPTEGLDINLNCNDNPAAATGEEGGEDYNPWD
ncbi:MAG: transglycosylase domain-containing protein [Flavobacteriales bacterium]|nr:transglycosylase domain-containing protein [Flavobacteriales bacterium]